MFMFITGFFAGIWPLVQANILGVLAVGGGFAFWKFSPLGKDIGAILATVALLATFAYDFGVHDGESYVNAQSVVVTQKAVTAATSARAAAEKSVGPVTAKPAAGGVRRVLPHKRADKFDRG